MLFYLDVEQESLETCIPRIGKTVMVVMHQDASLVGQLAKLLNYNDKNHEADIQYDLTFDFDTVGYDQIAEFVHSDH